MVVRLSMMTISCKDEIIHWFRQQSASLRVETLCNLMECCVPFEIRFVGTVLENLGRRDFHELRDAQHRANSFMATASNLEESRALLLASLMNDGSSVPSNGGISQSFPNPNLNRQHSPKLGATTPVEQNNIGGGISVRNTSNPSIGQDTQDSSLNNRPNRPAGEQKNWSTWVADGSHPSSSNTTSDNKTNTSSTISSKPTVNNTATLMNGYSTGTGKPNNLTANHMADEMNISPGESDEDADSTSNTSSGDIGILMNEMIRRRMILYLSLLSATNRDGANTFYILLVSHEISPGAFERLTESALAELALLYTIGFYHPAFSFSQHAVLREILMQIKFTIHRRVFGASPGVYYAQAVDPKTGNLFYYPITNSVMLPPPFPQSDTQHVQPPITQVPPQTGTQHHQLGGTRSPGPIQGPSNFMPATPTPTDQAKSGIPDKTRISNHPVLPYHYPANYPVFMGQSPPNSNSIHSNSQVLTNPTYPTVISVPIPTQQPPPPVINHETRNIKQVEKGVGVGGPIMNGHDILIPITITDPSHQIPVNAIIRSRNMSCFNCGSKTHYGQDCKELSMEEMTKYLYRLNFNANTNAESS